MMLAHLGLPQGMLFSQSTVMQAQEFGVFEACTSLHHLLPASP